MDMKWLLILVALIAIAFGALVGGGFDSMNDSIYDNSQDRSGVNVEHAPVPQNDDDAE
jgi:hypothetical protein